MARECTACGKRLTYVGGFRGFGIRERRHAAKCRGRAGIIMACDAMVEHAANTENQVPWRVVGGRWRYEGGAQAVRSAADTTPGSKTTEEWQVASGRWKYKAVAETDSHGGVQKDSAGIKEFATEEPVADHKRDVEVSKLDDVAQEVSLAVEPTRYIDEDQATGETLEKRGNDSVELPQSLGAMLDTAVCSGELAKAVDRVVAEQDRGNKVPCETLEKPGNEPVELPQCLGAVMDAAVASGELAKAVDRVVAEQGRVISENDATVEILKERGDAAVDLSQRLAALLDVAVASGELAKAVDRVVVEQGIVTYEYSWQQHIQTPLPTHLEDERRRFGIDEDDWWIRLSATDNEGFYLDLSDFMHYDQFPAAVTFDARGNWWYLRR